MNFEEDLRPSERHLVSIMYCRTCWEICTEENCRKCGRKAARTEGTIDEYKHVAQALLDHRSEWQEMIERMLRE